MDSRIEVATAGFWRWKHTVYRLHLDYPFDNVKFDNLESAEAYLRAYDHIVGRIKNG